MVARQIEEIIQLSEWRKRELEALKKISLVSLSNLSEEVKRQFLRMSILYVYAHWEGYVIEAFKVLIGYLNELKLKNSEVNINLLVFSRKTEFQKLTGNLKFSKCCDFAYKLYGMKGDEFSIDQKHFSTNSNLRYSQLERIFEWFKMENTIKQYENDIDKLVNIRNRIAHGENGIIIEYDNLNETINIMIDIFDRIILSINDYLKEEKYLQSM